MTLDYNRLGLFVEQNGSESQKQEYNKVIKKVKRKAYYSFFIQNILLLWLPTWLFAFVFHNFLIDIIYNKKDIIFYITNICVVYILPILVPALVAYRFFTRLWPDDMNILRTEITSSVLTTFIHTIPEEKLKLLDIPLSAGKDIPLSILEKFKQ